MAFYILDSHSFGYNQVLIDNPLPLLGDPNVAVAVAVAMASSPT